MKLGWMIQLEIRIETKQKQKFDFRETLFLMKEANLLQE